VVRLLPADRNAQALRDVARIELIRALQSTEQPADPILMANQILVAAGNGLFILVSTAIGLRLLLLWRRTRELPEFLIGAGLLMPAVVTVPFAAFAGLSSPTVANIHIPTLSIGLLGVAASIALLMAFTWRVFRPSSMAAATFALCTSAAALVVCTLFVHSLATAPGDTKPGEAYSPYAIAIMLLFQIWYAWMAIESLGEWRRAGRRLALGLSDPVLVNRFGLWGCLGVAQMFGGAISITFEIAGLDMLRHTLPALALALNGLVTGTLMLLTFVPPARYLDWLKSRNTRRMAAASA
jgi:hypothetical protein